MTISQILLKAPGGLAALAVMLTAGGAIADTVTFDDLPGRGNAFVPSGYQGFNWYFFDVDPVALNLKYPTPGSLYPYWINGIISPKNVAVSTYRGFGQITTATPFAFNLYSVYLTSGSVNGKPITVSGFYGGKLKYTSEFIIHTDRSLLAILNFQNVDNVNFYSPDADGLNASFVVDNVNYRTTRKRRGTPVPEPATILGSAGAIGLYAALNLKRSKKTGKSVTSK